MNWQEACADRNLHDLPYKIELNEHGQLVLSPRRVRHGYLQAAIACRMRRLLPAGQILTGCGVDTAMGTVVADAVWASAERFAILDKEFSCSVAPEICVEVLSFSNTDGEMGRKRAAYLEKGAVEFWLCNEHGELSFFNVQGPLAKSALCPEFPSRID